MVVDPPPAAIDVRDAVRMARGWWWVVRMGSRRKVRVGWGRCDARREWRS